MEDRLIDDRDDVTPEAMPDADQTSSDTTTPTTNADGSEFHERLGEDEAGDFYDNDFIRSIDPEQNPHITDQLEDENLQREAESEDYQ